jgi:hypothetical protein
MVKKMSMDNEQNIAPGRMVFWSKEDGEVCVGRVLSADTKLGKCVVQLNDRPVDVNIKVLKVIPPGCTGCGDMSRGGCLVFGSCGGGR